MNTNSSVFKRAIFALIVLSIASCANVGAVSKAISAYRAEASRVELGQSKQQVLEILEPTQSGLSPQQRKSPEVYLEGETRKEIHFFRSRSFADGLVTDDEFVPYIFEDDRLVGIGWTVIGGPKTQAQSRENDANLHFHGRLYYY